MWLCHVCVWRETLVQMPVRVDVAGGALGALPSVAGHLWALLDGRAEAPEVEALPALVAPHQVAVVARGAADVAGGTGVAATGLLGAGGILRLRGSAFGLLQLPLAAASTAVPVAVAADAVGRRRGILLLLLLLVGCRGRLDLELDGLLGLDVDDALEIVKNPDKL